MCKFVSLLLIPLIVLGQSLPHSHTGTGVAEPNGHSQRPHVHFHSHDHLAKAHTHHNHKPSSKDKKSRHCELVAPLADHDSDAIYLSATTKLIRTYPSIVIDFLVADSAAYPIIEVFCRDQCLYRSADPPDKHSGLPFYLLNSSLLL